MSSGPSLQLRQARVAAEHGRGLLLRPGDRGLSSGSGSTLEASPLVQIRFRSDGQRRSNDAGDVCQRRGASIENSVGRS